MALHVLPVASPLHGEATCRRLARDLAPALGGAPLVRSVDDAPPGEPLAVLVLTGGTEARVVAAHRARQAAAPGEPLVLLAHPDHNSLPAALESLARVHQDGARGWIAPVAAGAGPAVADQVATDLAVWHRLRRFRLGVVGAPSEWLVASMPEADAVRSTWGPTLVPVDLRPVLRELALVPAGRARALAVSVRAGAGVCVGDERPHRAVGASDGATIAGDEVLRAAAFEPALRDVVARERLDALTVRCFDLVTEAGTSGCLALSALNDAGLVAGCEGDVPSTLALTWVRLLLDRPGWMANPVVVDPVAGRVRLAHCTVPRTMVEGYDLSTHFESGCGVGLAGRLPAGPVTLLRLGGRNLERWWVAEGEARPTVPTRSGCRTQLDVGVEPSSAQSLLARPLGNHLVLVLGHHAARLRRWWDAVIRPVA